MTPMQKQRWLLTYVHQWTTWDNEQKYTPNTVSLAYILYLQKNQNTKTTATGSQAYTFKGLFLINMGIVPITKIFHHAQTMHLEHTGKLKFENSGPWKYRRYVILKLISLPRKQNVPKELFQGYLPFWREFLSYWPTDMSDLILLVSLWEYISEM